MSSFPMTPEESQRVSQLMMEQELEQFTNTNQDTARASQSSGDVSPTRNTCRGLSMAQLADQQSRSTSSTATCGPSRDSDGDLVADREAIATRVLLSLQHEDPRVPDACSMVATELLGRGLDSQSVIGLLRGHMFSTEDAIRIFNALQREAAHEALQQRDERQLSQIAGNHVDQSNAAVDTDRLRSVRQGYRPAPGSASAGAVAQQLEALVAQARLSTFRAEMNDALARLREFQPFVQEPFARVIASARAGSCLALLEAMAVAFARFALPWDRVAQTACQFMAAGIQPLVAWSAAVEQYSVIMAHAAVQQRPPAAVGGASAEGASSSQPLIRLDEPHPSFQTPAAGSYRSRPSPVGAALAASPGQGSAAIQAAIRERSCSMSAALAGAQLRGPPSGGLFDSESLQAAAAGSSSRPPLGSAHRDRDDPTLMLPPPPLTDRPPPTDRSVGRLRAAAPLEDRQREAAPREEREEREDRPRSPSAAEASPAPAVAAVRSVVRIPPSGEMPHILAVYGLTNLFLSTPCWYTTVLPAEYAGTAYVGNFRSTWADLLRLASVDERDVSREDHGRWYRLRERVPPCDIEQLAADFEHPIDDNGLSFGQAMPRGYQRLGRLFIHFGLKAGGSHKDAYLSLAEYTNEAFRLVSAFQPELSEFELLSQACETAEQFREILSLTHKVYFGGGGTGADQLWFGFSWEPPASAHSMAKELLELARKLQKSEPLRIQRFDSVVRAARKAALRVPGDEPNIAIVSSIHDRFVNVRAPGVATLQAVVDKFRFDEYATKPLSLPGGDASRPIGRGKSRANDALSHAAESVDADALAQRVADKLRLSPPPGLSQPAPVYAGSVPPGQIPPPTMELPEVVAIMNELGFDAVVAASTINIAPSRKCYDTFRILMSRRVPRLGGIQIQWYEIWNSSRGNEKECPGEWGLACALCGVGGSRCTEEHTYQSWGRLRNQLADKNIPRHVIIMHNHLQCGVVTRLTESFAKDEPQHAWMLQELSPANAKRLLVAAKIHSERVAQGRTV